MIVAIDGPAGSGKSTVARALARQLRCSYLDTGAMYRCVGLAALRRWGADAASESRAEALGVLAEGMRIELRSPREEEALPPRQEEALPPRQDEPPPPRQEEALRLEIEVLLDGEDVTAQIRTNEVSEMASVAAAIPRVRKALLSKQREMIASGDWVAEGRDIGTVVAPEAALKVFLVAEAQERARRRARELGADFETVLAEQAIRDSRDEGRDHSPLRAAADARVIDTTGRSVRAVVEEIAALVQGCLRSTRR